MPTNPGSRVCCEVLVRVRPPIFRYLPRKYYAAPTQDSQFQALINVKSLVSSQLNFEEYPDYDW